MLGPRIRECLLQAFPVCFKLLSAVMGDIVPGMQAERNFAGKGLDPVQRTHKIGCDGQDARPEIMVPLVGSVDELRDQKAIVEEVAAQVREETGVAALPVVIGTMIEVPRAALLAAEIAAEAQFFSFGTNDLTQMTFGFSRDDVGTFLPLYLKKGFYRKDPFASLDQDGVGQLVALATERGRGVKTDLKVGICGEHGGDPASIDFFHKSGLDYVSCSPFRVPIARLAAAQSALEED